MPRRPTKPSTTIAQRRATGRTDPPKGYLDRRKEIVAAAAQIFKERGYRGTTVTHIAQAMGTDRASLYYYVSSKDELFQDIVSEVVKVNLVAASEIRDGEGSAPDKLRRLVEGLMASYAEYYPVLYVLIQENLSHVAPQHSDWAREMRRVNREYEAVLIDIIKAGQEEGTVRADAPPRLLAYGVIGIVGWTNRWFNPTDSPLTAQEIGTVFADTLLHGMVVEPT